jgi:hypothetical protein
MDLQEVDWIDTDWISVPQDTDSWPAQVKAEILSELRKP